MARAYTEPPKHVYYILTPYGKWAGPYLRPKKNRVNRKLELVEVDKVEHLKEGATQSNCDIICPYCKIAQGEHPDNIIEFETEDVIYECDECEKSFKVTIEYEYRQTYTSHKIWKNDQ